MSSGTYTCIWLVSSICFVLTALNSQAIISNQPCHAKEIGNNTILSNNVGTTLTLSDFIGVCLSWLRSLEKIACRWKDAILTKCVNESSTASLCYNNTVDIYDKKNPDGNYTIFVSVPKELIDKCSPVDFTAHFRGTSADRTCYYNRSVSEMASNQTYLTEKPPSKLPAAGIAPTNSTTSLKADPDADTPMYTNSTVAPIASVKPDPDVGTTTNSTVTPSLKPHPDVSAGTPTNYSTVTPSLKPHPNAGKLEVGPIVGVVFGILVVLILSALFYCGYKKGQQRRQEQSYNLRDRKGNQGTAA